MSRKGGQNKGKDGGALLDPHGRTVSVKVNEDGNLEVIPDDDNDVHMVEALGSLQNGDPASSSITITASGKPLGVASPGSLQPDSPIPLLDAIRQVNHSEWLKKNLDGVGFDTQSHHDELDGHLASDSKEVCQLFVLADGVGNGAPAEDGLPAADGLGSGGQPVAVSRGSASEVPEQGGQVLANHLAVTTRTNSELAIEKSSNKKEQTLEMVSDIHVQAVTESNSKQSLNVFNPESSDTDDLGIPVLEFQDLQQSNSKNNTLLTPQELENIPDECLDLDETMENSMEDFVKKIWRGTSNITDLPVTSGVSLLSDNEVNKINNSDNDMIVNAAISQIMNESSAAEVATSLKLPSSAVCSETAVTQASVNSSPVLAYNNGSSVVLPSPVISVSQVPTSPVISQMGTSGAVSTSTLPANCTLATIYISTDKGANSTQIRVNAGGSQQLYQLNTASLTGAPPLATVVQNTAPPTPVVPPVQKTGEIVSPSGDSLTGYLLLPVGQSDTNGILMSVPLGSVAKGGEEHVLEPSEIPPGTAYDSTTKIWHCLEDGCGKAFKKQSKLRIHQMRHTGERPFRCTRPGCGWAFTTGYKLRRHEESHEGRKDYICDIDGCKRKFTTIYNLNSHRRLHERPCNEVCQEPGCGERFHTKRQLDLHMKNHVGAEKNYKCPVSGCDKVFFSPNCMGSHARVHQQEREDLTCKFEGCGKTFEKLCRLRQHMRSHTGEKPYICTYDGCGWAFTTASKLTRHMNKHTGERRWECPIEGCGKAFMRAEHLKGHVVTHSGARPFLCPVEGCNSRFTAKSSLYVHLKKHDHSGEKIIYFCPMEGCEKKYATKSCLRNHITKHYSTPVADSDHAHFDLVPLLAGEDLPEESLDSFTAPQGDNVTTPVSAVNINTSIATSLLGTADPVLISPSDYITSGVDQPVITTTSFPSDGLTQQLTTQYIVSGDLPTPGVFSGALMGVPPPPGSPVSVCTSCSSPTLACSCSQSPETTAGPSTGSGGKHKAKIAIGQGASQRVLQENSSGSARTDYRSNYMLSDRAKKRRLMLKEKVDLPTMPVPTAVVVNGNLVTLGDNGTTFRAAEVLNSQGITYRDPDTGTTYVQTQLLQDDPPNPDLFPDDTTLTSDLVTLHDPSSSDVSTEFTGTTINLQDLE